MSQECENLELCVLCGGTLDKLGVLGVRAHYRCRDCGLEQSMLASVGLPITRATETPAPDYRTMTVCQLARAIARDWKKVYFGAVPYLDAMHSLDTVDEPYGQDSGRSIVRYFLCNAQTWRGPVAKAVKAELNRRVK